MFNAANVSKPQGLTTAQRNSLNFSGSADLETGAVNGGNFNFNHLLKSGATGSINGAYTPNSISGGLSSTFGKNNSNSVNLGTSIPIGNNPNSATINGGVKLRFQDGGVRGYQDGGVTSYQTRGLVMSEERQAQYDQHIKFVPQVGYVGPDGTRYGFNEADVVDFVNRGGLDSYNPNQGGSYMPSDEAMEGYAQEDFNDMINNSHRLSPQDDFSVVPEGTSGAPSTATPTAAPTTETGTASGSSSRGRSNRLVNDYSPVSDDAAFSDVNSSFYDFDGNDDADATGVDLRNRDGMDFLNDSTGAETVEDQEAKAEEIKAAIDKFVFEKEKAEYDKLSAKDKAKLKLKQLRGELKGAPGDHRLLKAAQFIPAAMAFMDKPDYMKNPEKVGSIDRVNLENVSLDDRQAAIKSDNAAMQRFISNAGMGSAGFAARMAGWQKKEGLAAAVTAEQRRMNTDINNREATMNTEIDARNKGIQRGNIEAGMRVDQFNTESEAATKSQQTAAMATATMGLLTQQMDKDRIAADDRRTRAIEGETKVMEREKFNTLASSQGLKEGTDSYASFYEDYFGTKYKLGGVKGMRKIPSYGYSK